MAYITIPGLPLGTDLTGSEQFESVQSSISVRLTANQLKAFTSNAPSLFVEDSATNTIATAATLVHDTTATTPAIGFGVGLDFETEVNTSGSFVGAQVQAVTTNVGVGTETFALAFNLLNSGVNGEVGRFVSKKFGVGTSTPDLTLHSEVTDTANASVTRALQLTHAVTNTPGNNIGTGIAFEVETAAANNEIGAAIDAVARSVSAGLEEFDLVFSLMNEGAAIDEVMRLRSTGSTSELGARLGVNTSAPNATLEIVTEDGNDAAAVAVARFTHLTQPAAPAIGIGTAIEFATETSSGTTKVGGAIYTQSTTLGASPDFDMGFSVMANNVAGVEVMRITSDKRLGVGTTTPARTLSAKYEDGTTTAVPVARLTRTTTTTPAANIGAQLEFEVETSTTNSEVGVVLSAEATTITSASEVFNFKILTMSGGLAATEKLRVGDIVYTPQPFGAGTVPDSTAWIHAGSGTTTVAPIDFDSGSLLTTPFAGAMEYDGRNLYFTPSGTQRGAIQSAQIYQLNANSTGNGAITTIQPLFPRVASVQASTRYQYELVATVVNTAATAKALQYALNTATSGSATFSQHQYLIDSFFAAATTTPTASNMMRNFITGGFNTLVSVTATSGAAAGSFVIRVRGSFDVNIAGIVDFSFGLTQVGTSVTINAGSYVMLWPAGDRNVDTEIGAWS